MPNPFPHKKIPVHHRIPNAYLLSNIYIIKLNFTILILKLLNCYFQLILIHLSYTYKKILFKLISQSQYPSPFSNTHLLISIPSPHTHTLFPIPITSSQYHSIILIPTLIRTPIRSSQIQSSQTNPSPPYPSPYPHTHPFKPPFPCPPLILIPSPHPLI